MDVTKLVNKPDLVYVQKKTIWDKCRNNDTGGFSSDRTGIMINSREYESEISVKSDEDILRIFFRWNMDISPGILVMADALERSYGDIEWKGIKAERDLPWYVLCNNSIKTDCFGVKTSPSAICIWRVDQKGISLYLDIRNGTNPVNLNGRILKAAVIVTRKGTEGENPFEAGSDFCSMLCDNRKKTDHQVYGSNNWYYAYGKKTSHKQIIKDAKLIKKLAPFENKPYMVIDNGWQECCYYEDYNGGPWKHGNRDFPDMKKLAEEMKEIGVRPGIWFRPLQTVEKLPAAWRRYLEPEGGYTLDPSHPGVLEYVKETILMFREWGFELIKHDFTARDILGSYPNRTGMNIFANDAPFYDRTITTAEIFNNLYSVISEACGNAVSIASISVSHFSAGKFNIFRTGDDTSSKSWDRTRKNGVNSLAMRMIQHNSFYETDADCAGIDGNIPWELNRQWVMLLAKSGTPFFVSPDPDAMTDEIIDDLKNAYSMAHKRQAAAEPLGWTGCATPLEWKINGKTEKFELYPGTGTEFLYEYLKKFK